MPAVPIIIDPFHDEPDWRHFITAYDHSQDVPEWVREPADVLEDDRLLRQVWQYVADGTITPLEGIYDLIEADHDTAFAIMHVAEALRRMPRK